MRYWTAFVLIVTLSGCDHDGNRIESETNGGAADSGAAQTPALPASETLKVTYSKSDPYQASQPVKKETVPSASAPEHAGHDMKKMTGPDMKDMPGMEPKTKPSQESKPSHEEHPSK